MLLPSAPAAVLRRQSRPGDTRTQPRQPWGCGLERHPEARPPPAFALADVNHDALM